jgi:chemotaxis regulatin CheY-phosphate phosphatase CheZ
MDYPQNMSELFGKLNDLKAVFVYGQKIIPVIQSLIDFMKDTVPLLENINHSIEESTHKIPTAKDKITDVSAATELATTEILDIVDDVSVKLTSADESISECLEWENNRKEKLNELKSLVKNNRANELINELYGESIVEKLNKLKSIIQKVNESNYQITLSLQVQDITSQQLAAVNHLIEAVQYKLTNLITDLEDTELKEIEENYTNKEIVFDEHANYSHSEDRQSVADGLFNNHNSKNTTQDEIDKLFSETK